MKATRTRRQPKGKEKEKIGENGKLMTQALFVHKYSHGQATASAPVVRLQNLSQNNGQRKGICKVNGRAQYMDLLLLCLQHWVDSVLSLCGSCRMMIRMSR